ncbi:MAG: copA [Thermoleophilia bacterium]|nr:copA [Thermoleophilia bacterium]
MTGATTTDLRIEGMTCAACAQRVERSLGSVDGVAAHVNFATGIAHVEHGHDVDVATLVDRVDHAGYDAHVHDTGGGGHVHHEEDPRGLRLRLLVAIPLTLPIVLLMFATALRFEGWELVALALGTPVALWCAAPFHRTALRSARHRAANMDTLVSMGVLAAWSWSAVSLLLLGGKDSYVEVAAVTTTLLLAGRVLEARARTSAGDAIRSLLELATKSARVLGDDGTEREVEPGALRVGDRLVVRPGERIATDGIIDQGASAIDRSIVTGETVPEAAGVGDEVLGGTVVVDGRVIVRATRVGADTALAQVARLVEAAQAGRAQIQRLADRISAIFVPIVILLAAATLAGWLVSGAEVGVAITAAVAVLIVACPCALGLATPAALLVGTGRGAQLGIVIGGPEVLERVRDIDTVLLDKTGTITTGEFALEQVVPAGSTDVDDALRTAWALEAASEHPIAQAVSRGAQERLAVGADAAGSAPEVEDFANHAGRGVVGVVDGRRAVVGREPLFVELGLTIPEELAATVAAARGDGATSVLVGWDGSARAALVLRDQVKPDSVAAIAALHGLGLRTELVTGDASAVGHAVAQRVGIADVTAETMPADKDALVAARQADGRRVAMVGDGINDAPALARADLGIAIGTGADVAIEASDLTLVSGSLWAAVDAIRLARATLRTIRGNLFWAFAYNVAALPLAVAGLLSPMVAGAAMAASSLFVLGNSLRLRSFRTARPS